MHYLIITNSGCHGKELYAVKPCVLFHRGFPKILVICEVFYTCLFILSTDLIYACENVTIVGMFYKLTILKLRSCCVRTSIEYWMITFHVGIHSSESSEPLPLGHMVFRLFATIKFFTMIKFYLCYNQKVSHAGNWTPATAVRVLDPNH